MVILVVDERCNQESLVAYRQKGTMLCVYLVHIGVQQSSFEKRSSQIEISPSKQYGCIDTCHGT